MISFRTLIIAGLLLCLTSIGVGAAVVWYWRYAEPSRTDSDAVLRRARRELTARNWTAAKAAAEQIEQADRHYNDALLILGEVAARQDRWDEALTYYARIPRDGTETDVRARLASADIEFNQGRLQLAHDDFRYGLSFFPDEPFALSRLSLLLDFSGRRFEASQLLFDLVRRDQFSESHLLFLAEPSSVHEPALEVKRTVPDEDDALINLANGRYALWRDDRAAAREFLSAARRQAPGLVEAWVRVGELDLLEEDETALSTWLQCMPAEAEEHPGYWLILARWAETRGDEQGAIRCYWETLRRDPNLQTACYRLSRLLPSVSSEIDPQPFLKRSLKLQELSSLVTILYHNQHHVDSMRSAAGTCEDLGRYWEAAGWARAALLINRKLPWALEMTERCLPRLNPAQPRNDPKFDPSRQIDLSGFPLPTSSPPPVVYEPAPRRLTGIRFQEEAAALGIDFAYFNGPDPSTPSGRMFEFTGGGMAAVDFDRDGWCDLYWVQGCEWPPVSGQQQYLDRLFRNQRERFTDVSQAARLREDRFGQGVTVGDVDQDGFPDLYVANTHQNRLWRNLGDGTFEDVTPIAGLTASKWTTSCLMADLNDDGLPDLVDVNYAEGDDVFSRICEQDGIARSCSPLAFPAANDQAFLNAGDGRFVEISEQIGFDIGEGRGLGIVAFRPTAEHRGLNLFVANDMTANFYFVSRALTTDSLPQMEEQGVIAGVAFDANGSAQASMGIAVADADGNGLVDFCVTNFHAEPNNLFLQFPGDSFVDNAAGAQLRDASYPMLGFGTQFLDADWDGWPDLFVTNGHVDDFGHRNLPYRMPPQFFCNRGAARFDELPAAELGAYFEQKWLGRGLARLDWNRDRRDDLAISHLDSPAALLTNRTESAHHAISLQLFGRSVDREGIGTIVRITTEDRVQVLQLTAGDGYESSNDRRLIIGVGDAATISRMEVSWCDGTSDGFDDVTADRDYVLVQGRPLLTLASP